MMNCQSLDWSRSSSRAAWASTGSHSASPSAAGASDQNRSSSAQSRSQVHRVSGFNHMLKSPLAPHEPGASAMADSLGEAARCSDAVRAVGPVPAASCR